MDLSNCSFLDWYVVFLVSTCDWTVVNKYYDNQAFVRIHDCYWVFRKRILLFVTGIHMRNKGICLNPCDEVHFYSSRKGVLEPL